MDLFRNIDNGYGLDSGNSIPEYVFLDGCMVMIEGAKAICMYELRV